MRRTLVRTSPEIVMLRRDFLRVAAGTALGASLLPFPAIAVESMRRRSIPSTGEELPVVGFGTWQTFDVDPADDGAMNRLSRVVRVLFEHGGRVIDSSPMYGRAERVVGTLLAREALDRDDAFLATKVWTRGRDEGERQMRASAAKMNADPALDLVQIHNLVDWRTHLWTLRSMKDEGTVRYVGLTHYTDRGVGQLADVIRREDGFDFVQCAYSLGVRQAARDLFPLCADRGVAVIVNRPFEGGAAFRGTRGHEIPAWAREELDVETWAQFFLKFVVGDPRVTCVIPGTGKVEHARDNVRAGFGPLPDVKQQERMVEAWETMQ